MASIAMAISAMASDILLMPLLAGMVQAWVAHFVTPLKSENVQKAQTT